MSALATITGNMLTLHNNGVVIEAGAIDGIPNSKRIVILFENGFAASIISHSGSYGGRDGLWEIAVLNEDGDITYGTPVTGDVIGWLDVFEVDSVLSQIAGLPDYRIAGYSIRRPSFDFE